MSSEKTEEPTHKKLEDARKKGDTGKSKDFVKAVTFIASFGYLLTIGGTFFEKMKELVLISAKYAIMPFNDVMGKLVELSLSIFIEIVIPFIGLILFAHVIGDFLHAGLIFSTEKLKPSFKNFDVVSNIKQMFSLKSIIELLKSILKIVVLVSLFYYTLVNNLNSILYIPEAGDINNLNHAIALLFISLIIPTMIIFFIIAAADLKLQNILFMKQQMMSKEDIKNEYKESEGDQEIKGKRKEIHKEIVSGDEGYQQAVNNSSAVITNPTRLAIAIYLGKSENARPILTVKARNEGARLVREAAKRANVPIIENVALARKLMSDVPINTQLPDYLLENVLDILTTLDSRIHPW